MSNEEKIDVTAAHTQLGSSNSVIDPHGDGGGDKLFSAQKGRRINRGAGDYTEVNPRLREIEKRDTQLHDLRTSERASGYVHKKDRHSQILCKPRKVAEIRIRNAADSEGFRELRRRTYSSGEYTSVSSDVRDASNNCRISDEGCGVSGEGIAESVQGNNRLSRSRRLKIITNRRSPFEQGGFRNNGTSSDSEKIDAEIKNDGVAALKMIMMELNNLMEGVHDV